MQLALFTPGAYLWPVYRNFETFLAALGSPSTDAPAVAASPVYPARVRTDSAVQGLSERMDQRLSLLHREVYSALLRPREYFRAEQRCFADIFWPDLRHTTLDQLFEALSFFFMRRRLHELDITQGLSLLRAVFFNHEAADPALWLAATLERLTPERLNRPTHSASFDAPATARVEDLAFCFHAALDRPTLSSGWCCGSIMRQFDGRLRVDFECGLDPALLEPQRYSEHAMRISGEVALTLRRIFGWREAIAA